MSLAQIYRERAAEERSAALASELANVRDRCLRSADVWEKLAEQAERVGTQRAIREDEAARRASS